MTTSLLYSENLPQYTATTLTSVHHQFIVKLKFKLKCSQNNNVTKVKASAGSQQ